MKENNSKKEKTKSKNNSQTKWTIFIIIATFILSLLFSFISNVAVGKLNIIFGVIILILVIGIGILFDLIGVAVTVAEVDNFNAQASKKIKGAKTSLKLIKNSAKVSNFCADVIGDICGVLSGAISAVLAIKVAEILGLDMSLQFIFGAIVSSLTVGGKAITKQFAINNSTKIVSFVSKLITIDNK